MSAVNPRYQYAYIVVTPEPSGVDYGVESQVTNETTKQLETKYVFWLKIGDTSQPEPMSRLADYKNPDQKRVFVFTSLAIEHQLDPSTVAQGGLGGGKQLEKQTGLEKYESGGLGQAERSEWHALYANSRDDALKLAEKLNNLLDDFNIPGPKSGFTEEHMFAEVVNKVKNALPPLFIPKRTSNFNAQIPKVTILTVPSIHKDASNRGYVFLNKNQQPTHRYWVRIAGSTTIDTTPHQLVSSKYMTETPDFGGSQQKGAMDKVKADLNKMLRDALQSPNFDLFNANNEKGDTKGWYSLDIQSDKLGSVIAKFRDFLDKFNERETDGSVPMGS
ncbi:hypothetical protein FRC07_001721 [Ceratobasidium sp. 392]|nr:hypothetical protein FRC07_001721 [Ceratobasidium sp. 392]